VPAPVTRQEDRSLATAPASGRGKVRRLGLAERTADALDSDNVVLPHRAENSQSPSNPAGAEKVIEARRRFCLKGP